MDAHDQETHKQEKVDRQGNNTTKQRGSKYTNHSRA